MLDWIKEKISPEQGLNNLDKTPTMQSTRNRLAIILMTSLSTIIQIDNIQAAPITKESQNIEVNDSHIYNNSPEAQNNHIDAKTFIKDTSPKLEIGRAHV